MSEQRELTPWLKGRLEHLQRAQIRGVTLVEYARSAGVTVGSLYEAKRELGRRGVRLEGAAAPRAKGAGFIPVQVLSGLPRDAGQALCRLHGPGGWLIECSEWPQAGWVARVMAGGAHDSP